MYLVRIIQKRPCLMIKKGTTRYAVMEKPKKIALLCIMGIVSRGR